MKIIPSAVLAMSLLNVMIFDVHSMAEQMAPESENPTVTICLYQETEFLPQMAIYKYEEQRLLAEGTPQEAYYPKISWNVVDKSYLTEAEFQTYLWDELADGGGPDLILAGEGGLLDMQRLLESGYLYDISAYENREYETEYISGVLEAGQIEGKQYLIPVTVEFPIMFGKAEMLSAAGVTGNWADFEAFTANLTEAQETAGIAALTEDTTGDWLSQYGSEVEELKVIGFGTEEGGDYYLPYQTLEEKQSLLSGCGKDNLTQMFSNLMQWEDPADLTWMLVPDMDGKIYAEVSRAVGVNKNSRNPEAVLAALSAFENTFNLYEEEDVSANSYLGEALNSLLTSAQLVAESVCEQDYAQAVGAAYYGSSWISDFYEIIHAEVDGTVLMQNGTTGDVMEERTEMQADAPEVLSVMYHGPAYGEESPLTGWLTSAADKFAENHPDSDTYVQMIPFFSDGIILQEMYTNLKRYCDLTPDIVITEGDTLYGVSGFRMDSDTMDQLIEVNKEELDALYKMEYEGICLDGETAGIPVGAVTYGLWYNRDRLAELGISEEMLKEGTAAWQEAVRIADQKGREVGVETPVLAFYENNIDVIGLLSCFAEEELFCWNEEEEEWQTYQAVWTEAVQDMYVLIHDVQIDDTKRLDALNQLLDGSAVFVLGSSELGASTSQVDPWKEKNIGYISLSPYVIGYVAGISESCNDPEAAFDYILQALQAEGYEEAVQKMGQQPVTDESAEGCRYLPIQERENVTSKLWKALWKEQEDLAELAEKYEPYPWTE